MSYLGWIWLALLISTIYGAILTSLLLARSGRRLVKAGARARVTLLELRDVPDKAVMKTPANTAEQLLMLRRARRARLRQRQNQKLARQRELVARLDTLISEQVRRKK